jgi:anti-anti-sigma factor
MNGLHHTTGHVAIARGLGKVIVTVHGRLDRDTVPAVEETLVGLARDGGFDAVVIDLGDVSFLDGRGLGLLMDGSEMFGGQGREFVLSGPTPSVRKALGRNPATKNLHVTPP